MPHHRRTGFAVGNDYRAHGRTTAFFHTVGREKGDVPPLKYGCIGKQVAGQKNPLTAVARDKYVVTHRCRSLLQVIGVFVDTEGEIGDHFTADPLVGCQRLHPPVGGTGSQRFDEREAPPFHLVTEGGLDQLLGAKNVFRAVDRHPGGKGHAVQIGKQLGHLERCPVVFDVTAVGGGGGFLPRHGGRGHLSAGHAVGGIVDENDRDIFA